MEKVDLATFLKSQISLSEWLEKIGSTKTTAFRAEDNEKRVRLKVLGDLIGLPSDQPTTFTAQEVADRSETVRAWVDAHSHEKCALRLIPLDPAQPKYRTRGSTVADALVWFAEQPVDYTAYRVDFMPHPEEHLWSSIFLSSPQGFFGEIVKGSHHQLTQGLHEEGEPMPFYFTNNAWVIKPKDEGAAEHVEQLISMIRVEDPAMQERIKEKLNGTFAEEYLCGYFEAVCTPEFGTWFIDYNRMLWQDMPTITQPPSAEDTTSLRGQCGSPGCVEGTVRIVSPEDIATSVLEATDILVCSLTSPNYLPLMMQAAGIVTDQGGILSHAAIVARELNKPCVVGTRHATTSFANGDRVLVDATAGTIRKV
ncbi:MAG: PEP-utilizing enzyme [Patescibacteria group bacterium]